MAKCSAAPLLPRWDWRSGFGRFFDLRTRNGGGCSLLRTPLLLRSRSLQMIFATEALSIDLVHIFRARWPRREPSALCDDLDSADRLIVARRAVQFRFDRLAGKLFRVKLFGIELCEKFFLFV